MKKCSMNSRLGKVTVATIAMVAMFCGNASAKELDVPVNMLFSKNVESVKAVSDVYSPVTGEVTEINEELLDSPELINDDAYEAWFIKVKDVSGTEELLSAEEYEAFVASEE